MKAAKAKNAATKNEVWNPSSVAEIAFEPKAKGSASFKEAAGMLSFATDCMTDAKMAVPREAAI